MPKKFDQDAKDRVVRLVEDRVLAGNLSLREACQVVAPRLGVSWHTARQWVQHSRREGSVHRLEEDVIVENARLRRENQHCVIRMSYSKRRRLFSRQNSTRNVGNDRFH